MKLLHPGLLRRQYLYHSPLWSAYLSGRQLPWLPFQSNVQLFCARAVAATVWQQEPASAVWGRLKQYKGMLGDGGGEWMREAETVMQVVEGRHGEGYVGRVFEYLRGECRPLDEVSTAQPGTINSVLSALPRMSLSECQWLLLSSLPFCQGHLRALALTRLHWDPHSVAAVAFRRVLLRVIVDSHGCNDIAGMKSFIAKYLKLTPAPPSQPQAKVQDRFLSTIHRLTSQPITKNPLNSSYLQSLAAPVNSNNTDCQMSYLQLAVSQYMLYLDWLLVKILYCQDGAVMLMDFEQLLRHIDGDALGRGRQGVERQGLRLQLCKAEIVGYLEAEMAELTGRGGQSAGRMYERVRQCRAKCEGTLQELTHSLTQDNSIPSLTLLLNAILSLHAALNHSRPPSSQVLPRSPAIHSLLQRALVLASSHPIILYDGRQCETVARAYEIAGKLGVGFAGSVQAFMDKANKYGGRRNAVVGESGVMSVHVAKVLYEDSRRGVKPSEEQLRTVRLFFV